MTHLRASSGLLAALLCAVVAGGCGGKTSTDEPTTTTTTPITGWHSYAFVVTEAKISWEGGSFGDPTAVSVGKGGRMDLLASGVAGAVMTPFGDPVALATVEGALRVSKESGGGLSFAGSSGGTNVSESWDTFTFDLDARGAPIGGTATGRASAFSGDVGWMGKVTAKFTLSPDTKAPTFRVRTIRTFAPVSLPWEQRELLADEPFLETLPPTIGIDVKKVVTGFSWGDPARTYERGFTFRLDDWNDIGGIALETPVVRDAAGNASTKGTLPLETGMDLMGVGFARRSEIDASSKKLEELRRWGTVSVADCDGTACWAIGPFPTSYCGTGSQGGFATILDGAGGAQFEVRATAKARFSGSVPGIRDVVHLEVASPGRPPVSDASVKLPEKADSAGVYDTGWRTVTLSAPLSTAKYTGFAVSGGGVGAGAGDCGPAPPPMDVVVYVRRLAVLAVGTK